MKAKKTAHEAKKETKATSGRETRKVVKPKSAKPKSAVLKSAAPTRKVTATPGETNPAATSLKPSVARAEDIKRLSDLLRGLRICMMTTLTDDGHLHTRPMAAQSADFNGEFWFFTSDPSPKVREAREDARCSLGYMSESEQRYVTVSGRVDVIHDKDKMKELWEPTLKAWFPKGLSDPHLCLLRVVPETAEFWDPPSSALVRLVGFAKATLTGKPYDHSDEHDIIQLSNPKAGAVAEGQSTRDQRH